MKQKVYNLIVLDESGSMAMIAKEAVSGLNETLQSIVAAQKEHEEQEHYVSFVTFNSTRIHTVMNCQKVDVDKELIWDDFSPNSCTPLFDAMGQSVCELRNSVSKDDVVLVTIITDGMENASKEYDGKAIKKLVSDLKEKGWLFVYIGTNQDVDAVADSMGIRSRRSFEYSDTGAADMLCMERSRRRNFYGKLACHGKAILEEDFDFFEDDRSDKHEERLTSKDEESQTGNNENKENGGFLSKIRKMISA